MDPGVVVADRYRVRERIARGTFSDVYAAQDCRTLRSVAIKLPRDHAAQGVWERYRLECRAGTLITSEHVAAVLDLQTIDDKAMLVLELIEGRQLIDLLKERGPLQLRELYPIVDQVWTALADCHAAGVVHRCVKPSNVLLGTRNDHVRVTLVDFGMARLPVGLEAWQPSLTDMGQSLGVFSFMPPEQIGKAKTVDDRADIYMCATLIYQAMSGQLPYAAKNILQMVELKTRADPRPLSDALGSAAAPGLDAFLARCLARDPRDRFETALSARDAWRVLVKASLDS
jgi:serine/threonine-protein kinase